MQIPDWLLVDQVNISTNPDLTFGGLVTAGTTNAATNVACAILPLGDAEEAMMMAGPFDRQRMRVLFKPSQGIGANAKLTVVSTPGARIATNTEFMVEGDPTVFTDPLTGQGHHKQAIVTRRNTA